MQIVTVAIASNGSRVNNYSDGAVFGCKIESLRPIFDETEGVKIVGTTATLLVRKSTATKVINLHDILKIEDQIYSIDFIDTSRDDNAYLMEVSGWV